MTTATNRKPRKVNPVKCDLVTIRRLAYPCTLLPNGQPAHVTINGKPYVVTARTGMVCFHSKDASHIVSQGTCSCEDFTYVREARGEKCKHILAASKMIADGTI
jgi:SWIM zinc finger